MSDEYESDVRVPRAEQLLIDATADIQADRVLCTSLGWGQLAAATARRRPNTRVACHFLDLHPCEQAQHNARDFAGRIDWHCTADLPEGPFDLAAIPVSRFGEAELTREILQQAYERLTEGGLLVTAVDNRDDSWLADQLSKLFAKLTREPQRMGIVYRGVRRGPLKRTRDFRCEFAFRDQGRLVKAVSRPGVFSHRQLDLGARALLETMEVRAGDRVVDMGCGSGVVGLAAALRAEQVFVQGIDSNARAVACMQEGAQLNGIAVVGEEGDLRSSVWHGQETGHNPLDQRSTINHQPLSDFSSSRRVVAPFAAGVAAADAPDAAERSGHGAVFLDGLDEVFAARRREPALRAGQALQQRADAQLVAADEADQREGRKLPE